MVRGVFLLSIGVSLFASSEYIPFSKFSKVQQEEYNFIKVEKKKIEITKEKEVIINAEQINPVLKYEKPTESNIIKKTQIKKPISQNNINIEHENKKIVNNYKRENILKDEINVKDNSFNKDFSITPKNSYMYASTSIEGENIEKIHEIVPEISFVYKNHTLKADYIKTNVKKNYLTIFNASDFKLDTKWLRIAYLYKYYNANIGLAYNDLKIKSNYLVNGKDSEKFPTIEVHIKNVKDQLVLEYGGFYGKNSNEVKSAYEYYLNLGYRIFNNDNLVLNLGYKNRTIDYDGYEVTYEGPTLGISTTF